MTGNADDEGDACELDSDGDGVYDDIDNCVDGFNPGQDDRYSDQVGSGVADGIGDVCQAGTRFDLDGNKISDLAVFRPSDNSWIVRLSTVVNGQARFGVPTAAFTFGTSASRPAVADYDGDRKADVAYVDGTTWHWMQSSLSGPTMFGTAAAPVPFAVPGSHLVPADYDGDGKADPAVFDAATGTWNVRRSVDGTTRTFAAPEAVGGIPVVGDFDADARADFIAVVEVVGGTSRWLRWSSASTDTFDEVALGEPGDQPLAVDVDGDRRSDPVVYRPSPTGTCPQEPYMCGDSTNQLNLCCFLGPGLGAGIRYGQPGDSMALFDLDGDHRTNDLIAFRPYDGGMTMVNAWFVQNQVNFYGAQCTGDPQGALIPIGTTSASTGHRQARRPGAIREHSGE